MNLMHEISFVSSFIGAKDDGGGGDNWRYKTCKAPVKSSPLTLSFLSSDQQFQSTDCSSTSAVTLLR